MEIGSGRIIISSKQWLANQLDFFVHWVFCLLAILSVKKTSKSNLPAVLVFGVGEEALFIDGNDERFVNYCRLGPIKPLRNGKRFFVQSLSKNISSDRFKFVYCRRPLVSLLRETKMGFFGRLHLLINHIMLFFAYQAAVFWLPQLSLLGKDFAYSSISFKLDRLALIESVVFTNSCQTSQPLWMRALHFSKVHMVWYSQSAKTVIYSSDNLDSENPFLRWIGAGTHWVWTYAFAEYLSALGHHKDVKIVGPIVWYMPRITIPAKDSINIVIFDVPAITDSEVLLHGGELTNHYHPEKLRAFIDDIISLKSELEKTFHLPVSFYLKPKREYNAQYNAAYFDYLKTLDSLGAISLEHHSTNLYSLISGSHLVIAYPFTSPAYVAEFLGVPSIYYDPTNSISRQDFCDNKSLVHFANCAEDLLNVAISALRKVFPSEDQLQVTSVTVED